MINIWANSLKDSYTMEQLIRTEMRVLPVIDVDFEIQRRVEFIQKNLSNQAANHLY